jgi:ABC-type transporter Mla subunit MlaD
VSQPISNPFAWFGEVTDALNQILADLGTMAQQLTKASRQLNQVVGQELSIQRKENAIMADVKIAQETLDADGDALTQLATDLQTVINNGNLSEADQTKLQNGIEALQALDTLNVTPPAPAPEPTPEPTPDEPTS